VLYHVGASTLTSLARAGLNETIHHSLPSQFRTPLPLLQQPNQQPITPLIPTPVSPLPQLPSHPHGAPSGMSSPSHRDFNLTPPHSPAFLSPVSPLPPWPIQRPLQVTVPLTPASLLNNGLIRRADNNVAPATSSKRARADTASAPIEPATKSPRCY
jgi:hypothetical protein